MSMIVIDLEITFPVCPHVGFLIAEPKLCSSSSVLEAVTSKACGHLHRKIVFKASLHFLSQPRWKFLAHSQLSNLISERIDLSKLAELFSYSHKYVTLRPCPCHSSTATTETECTRVLTRARTAAITVFVLLPARSLPDGKPNTRALIVLSSLLIITFHVDRVLRPRGVRKKERIYQ